MANIRIQQLPEDLTPASTDVVAVDAALGGTTRKVPLPNLSDLVLSGKTASTINPSAIGKLPKFTDIVGRPGLYSSGSVFLLSTGAYTDTMNWYFQRDASYSGGGAGDSTAAVLSPVRSETYVRDTVDYAVEVGGMFMCQNESWLAQGVGVFGQATSVHGGRTFGLEAEAIETSEKFTATAGQTVFAVPNGYAANKAIVSKNDVLLTRTTDYVDSSGTNIVTTSPCAAGDEIRVIRGDPKFAASGAEIIVYAAGGSDDWNTLSGNRVGLTLAAWKKEPEDVITRVGTLLNLVSKPSDPKLIVDRGINAQGHFKNLIDFTAANLTVDEYVLKLNTSGAGIDTLGNLSLGSAPPLSIGGYTTLRLQNLANGSIFMLGDASHTGRISLGSGFGMIVGSDTDIDVLLQRNGSERARLGATALQLKLDGSAAPVANGYLVFEATSNTSLTVKYRGSDGTTRSAVLALS